MLARLFWMMAIGIVMTNGLLVFIFLQQDNRQRHVEEARQLGFRLGPVVSRFVNGQPLPPVELGASHSWQIIEPQGRSRAEVLQTHGMAGWPEQQLELPVVIRTPNQPPVLISATAYTPVEPFSFLTGEGQPRGLVAITQMISKLSGHLAASGKEAKLILDRKDGKILIMESPDYWRDEGALSKYDFLLYVALVLFFLGLPVAAGFIFAPIEELLKALRETRSETTPIKADGCQEVSEITFAINRLVGRLSRHMSERLSFVAAISHDLGVPATRLRLRAALIKDKKVRDQLIQDTNEMSAMIADSLQFLRNENVEEADRVIDFQSLVESVYEDYLDTGAEVFMNRMPDEDHANKPLVFETVPSMFTGTGVRLEHKLDGPLTLNGKPRALRRALGNLIDNALKYGQSALIEIEADTSSVLVKVSDRGPGIPEAEMSNVIQPYYRLEKSRSRDTGGTGLGLAIVNAIVRDHDGFLTMDNLMHGGLQVTIALPRNVPASDS